MCVCLLLFDKMFRVILFGFISYNLEIFLSQLEAKYFTLSGITFYKDLFVLKFFHFIPVTSQFLEAPMCHSIR